MFNVEIIPGSPFSISCLPLFTLVYQTVLTLSINDPLLAKTLYEFEIMAPSIIIYDGKGGLRLNGTIIA